MINLHGNLGNSSFHLTNAATLPNICHRERIICTQLKYFTPLYGVIYAWIKVVPCMETYHTSTQG